jgi:hypothetical protein
MLFCDIFFKVSFSVFGCTEIQLNFGCFFFFLNLAVLLNSLFLNYSSAVEVFHSAMQVFVLGLSFSFFIAVV